MDPTTTTPAPAAPLSLEAEMTAALEAAKPVALAAVEAVSAQAPAPSEDPKPTEPAAEKPKAEEPPKVAEPSLAKRLAILAREERRRKEEDARRTAEIDKVKPELDRLKRIREAPDKVEALRELLGNDDEAVADLFLQLNRYVQQKDQPLTQEQKLEQLVEQKLKARDDAAAKAREADLDKRLAAGRAAYASEVHAMIDGDEGGEFPHCYAAPPSQADIAAIAEAMAEQSGNLPTVEEVVKTIETHRRERFEARTAAKKKPAPATAPVKGEASGKQDAPIRRDDAPVTAPRKLTLEEELHQALSRL